jgi:hypothetical protein
MSQGPFLSGTGTAVGSPSVPRALGTGALRTSCNGKGGTRA